LANSQFDSRIDGSLSLCPLFARKGGFFLLSD
jgi:hypothetical protein